jgi:hypothetical protein
MNSRNLNDQTYDVAKKWLISLGTLCAGAMPLDEAQTRITAYSTVLCGQFAPHVFTQRSLERAARQFKFFPCCAELAEMLSLWGRENPPPAHAVISGPVASAFENWNAADHSWLKFWNDQKSAGFPPGKGPTLRQPDVASDRAADHRRAQAISLIRWQSPKAWDFIATGGA